MLLLRTAIRALVQLMRTYECFLLHACQLATMLRAKKSLVLLPESRPCREKGRSFRRHWVFLVTYLMLGDSRPTQASRAPFFRAVYTVASVCSTRTLKLLGYFRARSSLLPQHGRRFLPLPRASITAPSIRMQFLGSGLACLVFW